MQLVTTCPDSKHLSRFPWRPSDLSCSSPSSQMRDDVSYSHSTAVTILSFIFTSTSEVTSEARLCYLDYVLAKTSENNIDIQHYNCDLLHFKTILNYTSKIIMISEDSPILRNENISPKTTTKYLLLSERLGALLQAGKCYMWFKLFFDIFSCLHNSFMIIMIQMSQVSDKVLKSRFIYLFFLQKIILVNKLPLNDKISYIGYY